MLPLRRYLHAAADTLLWVPSRLRWDPERENELTWTQISFYSMAVAVGTGNMYYSQPILNILAREFGVPDERASLVPTLSQAGYACGLLLLVPLGDIVKRRPMILLLMLLTATMWLGTILTDSFPSFLGLSFLVGLLNVTPQLIYPLAIQYAPQRRRATATATILSGSTVGVLLARLLSGIVAQYAPWRSVYWLSLGLQLLTAALLFATLPDYPVLRPGTSYPRLLLSIALYPLRYPVLTQQSLVVFLFSAMFSSFWTTLTFQLVGPFRLSTLAVGLFALIGIATAAATPPLVGALSPRVHPSGMSIIGHAVGLAAASIGTFVGAFSLAGLVVWAALGDLAVDVIIVSTRLAVGGVDPRGQNVVNSVYMIFTYCGGLTGTAVGNRLYAEGGWIHSGAFGMAVLGLSLALVLSRGPHEERDTWFGWRGGRGLAVKTAQETTASRMVSEPDAGQALQEVMSREERRE